MIYYTKDDFCLYLGDSVKLLGTFDNESVGLIIADPPYFVDNNFKFAQTGKEFSTNKGDWDQKKCEAFTYTWVYLCSILLKPDSSMFIFSSKHNLEVILSAAKGSNLDVIQIIHWEKPNPPPNFSCKCLKHSVEYIIWCANSKKYYFDYKYSKSLSGVQLKDVWRVSPPRGDETKHGRHVAQKPKKLLERLILMGSQYGDSVLDPFCGVGSTGIVCSETLRKFVGIDNHSEYLDIAIFRNEDLYV